MWRKVPSRDERKQQFLGDWAQATWDDPNAQSQGEAEFNRQNPESKQGEVSVAGQKLTLDQVRELAKKHGWNDPTDFKTENLEQQGREDFKTYRLSSGWRKMDDQRTGTIQKLEPQYANTEYGDNTPITPGGWSIDAGELKGQKRHTRVKYDYDDAGNLTAVHPEADTRWYEDAAPLIGMAATALTLGGGAGMIGSSLNSGLNLGLGTAGANALGGAAIGAGSSALTGQNPLKGAALGGLGGAVQAINPAAAMGVSQSMQPFANGLLTTFGKSAIKGESPSIPSILGNFAKVR